MRSSSGEQGLAEQAIVDAASTTAVSPSNRRMIVFTRCARVAIDHASDAALPSVATVSDFTMPLAIRNLPNGIGRLQCWTRWPSSSHSVCCLRCQLISPPARIVSTCFSVRPCLAAIGRPHSRMISLSLASARCRLRTCRTSPLRSRS